MTIFMIDPMTDLMTIPRIISMNIPMTKLMSSLMTGHDIDQIVKIVLQGEFCTNAMFWRVIVQMSNARSLLFSHQHFPFFLASIWVWWQTMQQTWHWNSQMIRSMQLLGSPCQTLQQAWHWAFVGNISQNSKTTAMWDWPKLKENLDVQKPTRNIWCVVQIRGEIKFWCRENYLVKIGVIK